MSKIYCIECLQTGEKYIGSTKMKYISQRICSHRKRKSCCVSRYIINRDNYKYYLLEEVEESQGLIREQYYIDNTDNCINKQRAIRLTQKEYRVLNKHRIKKYLNSNKDKIKEYQANLRKYRYSWGGDPRYQNNLLLIDPTLFN